MTLKRFLNYIKFDTQSDPKSTTVPSSSKQRLLGEYLVKELKELGLTNAYLDDYGYVYGKIKGNNDKAKKIGFISHMDTAYDFSGKGVKARVIENYDGKYIVLNDNLVTKVSTFPFLNDLVNKTLVVTDGTTLLGADNKAGIAEIMSLVEYLLNNDIQHGDVSICFTPDEEIGRGADYFDLEYFNADFAYTVDGGSVGSIDYENFNAASAKVIIEGVSIHPGDSKDKMINAINVGMEFHSLLDVKMRPEYTEKYEGFYHLHNISGDVSKTKLDYIIRNHSSEVFNHQKQQIKSAAKFINNKYSKQLINVKIEDGYYNMADKLVDHEYIIDIAKKAIKLADLEAVSEPIRGGTDGAVLTYKGLLTPNLGTGGYNFHGPHELLVVEEMEKAVEVLINIVKIVGGI